MLSKNLPQTLVTWFQPLRRKLTLLISALLIAVIGAYNWFAHDRLHGALEDAARDRLAASGQRVSVMLAESAERLVGDLRQVAANPAVAGLLAPGSGAPSRAAASALRGDTPSRVLVSRALWSLDCALVARTPGTGPVAPCPAAPAADALTGGGTVSPFVIYRDTIHYSIAVPVTGQPPQPIGFLVETRTISGSGSADIEALIGEGVSMYVGNADGTLWTDLERAVEAPSTPGVDGTPAFGMDGTGTPVLGVLNKVTGAPWQVVLLVPRDAIAAPAQALLWWMALAALLCLAVGALGASMIGRRVTGPIEAIASAATGIAAGDYARRVPVEGHDELAHLGGAFNDMAARVETTTEALQSHALALEEQVQVARAARRDTAIVSSLLEDVLASAPVGVALFDLHLRYAKANAAMAALNGLPEDGHIGKTPTQVDGRMGELLEPLLVQVRESGETLANRRITAVAPGQLRRHWLVTGFPVRDADGSLTGVGVIALDTTSQHELEAQFLHVQKMEAVGRLAGSVAHDFNNLLTVILSYSSMAVESLGEQEALRGDMIEIRDAAMRAAALTRQLLAFSRNQVLEPRQINLNDTVRGMERLLERLMGPEITFDVDLDEALGDVRADPGQMEQVIMNLVVNARDAMPDGGRIVVATANGSITAECPLDPAEISRASAGECVVLSVCDTGTGLADEARARLFEPFFSTKPPGKGTGLGLSTVYGIVKQSGGDVRADDNAGPGTTFSVRLPRAE